MSLIVSRKRFEEQLGHVATRPREGDLIFFPLSKGLFEIKFVEHENPFYQLGKLYTFKLSCELFSYSQEEIDTGFSEIDSLRTTEKSSRSNYLVLRQWCIKHKLPRGRDGISSQWILWG